MAVTRRYCSTSWFALVIICILISLSFFYESGNQVVNQERGIYNLDVETHSSGTDDDSTVPGTQDPSWKTIGFATRYSGKATAWKDVFRRQSLNECEENRCQILTYGTGLATADSVIFNGNDLSDARPNTTFLSDLKKHRMRDQIYVFFTFEAPPRLALAAKLENYDNFFNWTMTYRKDSDVVMPNARVSKRATRRSTHFVTQEELKEKKMAIWYESDCTSQSRRDEWVTNLQRYIPVDTFGRCGEKSCGTKISTNGGCEKTIIKYIFYLAFENSLCTDYVTEKLYRALELGVIPVVLGDVDYTTFAPPNSVIDARQFSTVAELANHLKDVAEDSHLYNAYFDWRKDYDLELGSPYKPFICDLCMKLHEEGDNRVHKTYRSIKTWHSVERNCMTIKPFDK